jgi:hypothetical protein
MSCSVRILEKSRARWWRRVDSSYSLPESDEELLEPDPDDDGDDVDNVPAEEIGGADGGCCWGGAGRFRSRAGGAAASGAGAAACSARARAMRSRIATKALTAAML